MEFIVGYVIMIALLLFPLWKIFGKAGMRPLWSLLMLIPVVGGFACLVVLAFARWPALDPD